MPAGELLTDPEPVPAFTTLICTFGGVLVCDDPQAASRSDTEIRHDRLQTSWIFDISIQYSRIAFRHLFRCLRETGTLLCQPMTLVPDGKTTAFLLRIFQLIHKRNCKVFHGDTALPAIIGDQPVAAQAELAGTLARLDEAGWTKASPVDSGSARDLQGVSMCNRDPLPLLRKMTAVDKGDSGAMEGDRDCTSRRPGDRD